MADAFKPRFVDLVRNYTDTIGTGNLALGAAVSGYASFAAALNAGDQFYYSAISVETAQTEIGRGTLQPDGTIARDPVDGVLTDFSSGTKTVALVAAAEWFEGIQSSAIRSAGSRGEIAALGEMGAPILLGEAGREGIFEYRAGDRSTDVAVDIAQGVNIAPASDPSGASGAWVRRYPASLEVSWFGAAGDGITDDSAAIQAALDYLAHVGGGQLRLGDRTYATSGTLLCLGDGITIDARGATLVSSDSAAIPGLFIGGGSGRVLGGTWKLTGGFNSVRWFDIEGTDCEIDGAHVIKTPDASGVQAYVRSSATGFSMRNCRTEGSNGIFCEASNSQFLFNHFKGQSKGGDDALAIKAIQGTTEKIRIIGNTFENLAYFCSIGSEIGGHKVDDPTYSKQVRSVQLIGNNGQACSGILYVKPGAISAYDYRHGTVEAVTVSENILYDLDGGKFQTGFSIKAARGARVRNIKGSGNIIRARAADTESNGHKRGLDIFAVSYDSNDPEISDIDIGFTFDDPYDGAANSAETPGYPITNIVSLSDDSLAGGAIRDVAIRAEGNGCSGPGIDIEPRLDDAVRIEKAILRNVNAGGDTTSGGIKVASRLRIAGQVEVNALAGNAYCVTETGEVVGHVANAFFAEQINAGNDQARRPWAAPQRCYVSKVEFLSDKDIAKSVDDINYTQFELRNMGGSTNIFSSASSALTGGQAFPAGTYNTIMLARSIANSAQQMDCYFAEGAPLHVNKNDVGAGNTVRYAYLRIHWAPW